MKISAVVLAAGLGTRMKSNKPKVLHEILGKPMIMHIVDTLMLCKPEKLTVVVNPTSTEIKDTLKDYKIQFAVQREQKGTAHALKTALPTLKNFDGDVFVISGDTPLIEYETISCFYSLHKSSKSDISILSFIKEGEHSYGRIIRDAQGAVNAIIEANDIEDADRNVKEVNSGIYFIKTSALELLKYVKPNAIKGEYYLTDIVSIAVSKKLTVSAFAITTEAEAMGVNTPADLHLATQYLRDRIVDTLQEQGVFFMDKKRVMIGRDVQIAKDTIIYPDVMILGKTEIAQGCKIYPGCRIVSSKFAQDVIVLDHCVIEDAVIESNAKVGPFAHIRPGSHICRKAKIGNFVELKKTVMGEASKASHLSYLGDAVIGREVNIGAGTITCNYDGFNKYKTVIEDYVFIGSDTQLVAPVKVHAGAYVGAGSTITEDVPSDALAISRQPQRNIEGWAKARKKQQKSN